jgi:hypothetical protein
MYIEFIANTTMGVKTNLCYTMDPGTTFMVLKLLNQRNAANVTQP